MGNKDFHCYRNIFAIDPGYSFKNGTGYAIFDEKTYRLKSCGLIRPFAPGLEDHRATVEIAEKVKKIWEEQVGFSFDPEVLCIEYPQNCFVRNGFMVNSRTIIMLGILCARIEGQFSPQKPVRPNPSEWKRNKSKEDTEELVNEKLCAWSRKVLQSDLGPVQKHLHHNVYDAIGLGLWAIDQKKASSEAMKKDKC